MDNFYIRNASVNDIIKIKEICETGLPYINSHLEYTYFILFSYFSSTCKVAILNEKIVGFVNSLPSFDNKTIFIWQLLVIKEYRNKNVAQNLILNLINEAKNFSFNSIELTINSNNIQGLNHINKISTILQKKLFLKNKVIIDNNIELQYKLVL